MAGLADEQYGAAAGAHSHVPRAVGHGQRVGPVARQAEMAVTLVLTPRDPTGLVAKARGAIGHRRADVDAVHRPDAATRRRVHAWCSARGLEASADPDGYLVEARGAVADIEAAFGIRLDTYVVGRVRGRAVRTEPVLPEALQGSVCAVLGLSDLARPGRGRPERRGGAAGATGPASGAGYLPADIRLAYGLPEPSEGLDGSGETAVVFEFGSAYADQDLAAFWQAARVAGPEVSRVWALAPGQEEAAPPPMGAGVEATADIEWLGALAPGARIVVVNAVAGDTGSTFAQGLARALAAALRLKPTPTVISISDGDAEAFFAPAELNALDLLFARAAALGVSVVAASGDSGAYGSRVPVGRLESVDAPACLSHVLAVGGTHLELAEGVVAREVGWSDNGGAGASGGGVSAVFELPPWQDPEQVARATGGLSGRGVPDVCANADPLTGYRIILAERLGVVGGTSLAAPVWAAALTIVGQARRALGLAPLGLAARAIYPLAGRPTRLRDILVGDNAFLSAAGFRCATGWDAVSGLGAPAGPELWQSLAAVGGPQGPGRPAASKTRPAERNVVVVAAPDEMAPEPEAEPAVESTASAPLGGTPDGDGLVETGSPAWLAPDAAEAGATLPLGEGEGRSAARVAVVARGPLAPVASVAGDAKAPPPEAAPQPVDGAGAGRASVVARAPLTAAAMAGAAQARRVGPAGEAEPSPAPSAKDETACGSPGEGAAQEMLPPPTERAASASQAPRRARAGAASGRPRLPLGTTGEGAPASALAGYGAARHEAKVETAAPPTAAPQQPAPPRRTREASAAQGARRASAAPGATARRRGGR